jgi:trans-2,3-dihydro-3-hydroxyanthranilate isomerase
MGELRYTICDVFTDRPLAGNQLAVFSDARAIPEELMQPLARELNLSETTFVLAPEAGGDVRLRIFTPTVEMPFAGHPTLGSAWVLAAESGAERISLETAAGTIAVSLQRDNGQPSFAWMSQPVPTVAPVAAAEELLAAVGVAESGLPVEVYDNGVHHAYVCLDSADEVAALAPDQRHLAALAEVDGVSCFAVQGARATSRMFAPSLGVPEDPATGSAAGPLAVHLVRHGRLAAGEELVVSQGAQIARPSTLHARVGGTPTEIDSVEVGGRAVVVGAGRLRLP